MRKPTISFRHFDSTGPLSVYWYPGPYGDAVEAIRGSGPEAPKGVDGRSSDNGMILARLGWQPSRPLREGIEKTYAWIYDQYAARGEAAAAAGVTRLPKAWKSNSTG